MATAVTVVCPHCSNRMRASAEFIGRKGRCPSCKALIEIRAGAGEESLASLHPDDQANRAIRRAGRSTDASVWLSGLIAVGLTAFVYLAIVYPIGTRSFITAKFVNGGITSVCNTLITFWGLTILVMKYLAVKRQLSYAELELELIPLEIGMQIDQSNVGQFLAHLGRLPEAQRESILGRRIRGALEHFKARNSVPEVQQYLATQAELDASGVESGYTLLRSFIWANPILGFIGTVVGISLAVSDLNTAIQGSADAAQTAAALQKGMSGVTSGLATAFDTTYIGLVFAMLLLFPTESLRGTEYRMLDRIEEFTNESMLRRLSDETSGANFENMPEVVRDALGSAFHEHQRWLAQWQAQVADLGQVIGGELEAAANRVQERISQADVGRIEQLSRINSGVERLFADLGKTTEDWFRSQQDSLARSQSLVSATSGLQQSLTENAKLYSELLARDNGREPRPSLVGLETQLARLIDKLDASAAWEGPAATAEGARGGSDGAFGSIKPDGAAPRRNFFGRWRGGS